MNDNQKKNTSSNITSEIGFNPSAIIFGVNNCVFDYTTQCDDPVARTRSIKCTNINDDQSIYAIINNPTYIKWKSDNNIATIAACLEDIRIETIPNETFVEEVVFEGLTNTPQYTNDNGDQKFVSIGFQSITTNKIGEPGMPEGEPQEYAATVSFQMKGQPDPTKPHSLFTLQLMHFNDPSTLLNSRFKLYLNDVYYGVTVNVYSSVTSDVIGMESAKLVFICQTICSYNSSDSTTFKKPFKVKLVKTVEMPGESKYPFNLQVDNTDLPYDTALVLAYNNRIWKGDRYFGHPLAGGDNAIYHDEFKTDVRIQLVQDNPMEEALEKINYLVLQIGDFQAGSEKLPYNNVDFAILFPLEYLGPHTRQLIIKKADMSKILNLTAFSTAKAPTLRVMDEETYYIEIK